jgi:hypothetical protein
VQRQIGDVSYASKHLARHDFAVQPFHPLADVLGKIPNSLELIGDPQNSDDLA